MTPADIDSAAERAHTEAIRDHAARLIDGSEAYPFDRDDYCAVIELCDDHDAALDLIETLKAQRDRLARILAVERGDESAAPEGWRIDGRIGGRPSWRGNGGDCGWERGEWLWWRGPDWQFAHACGTAPTALDAMEAADAARGGDDG